MSWIAGQPTPFFGKTVDYIQVGGRWCQVENWSINGTLVGCSPSEIQSAKNEILSMFSNAFGSFSIGGVDLSFAEVKSVDIDSSDDIGGVPYSITLTNYPNDSFENHKVLDPSDSTTYTENEDGTVDIDRNISAKGVRTGSVSSALDNAVAFVNSRKSSVPRPFLLKNVSTGYYLVSSEESFNRITNEAKISQKFKADTKSQRGTVIHRYTMSEEEGISEESTRTYQGQIDVGRYGNISEARSAYNAFKNSVGAKFFLSEEVSEEAGDGVAGSEGEFLNRLTYNFSFYQDADIVEIQDDIVISFKESEGTNLLSASIQGKLYIENGSVKNKKDKIEAELSTVVGDNYNKGILDDFFSAFKNGSAKPSTYVLNSYPLSSSASYNEKEHTAEYSADFNDRYIPSRFDCKSIDASVTINYATWQRMLKEHYLGGKYICQDLGFLNRESVSAQINMEGVNSLAGSASCRNYALGLLTEHKGGASKVVETQKSYSEDSRSKTESYSVTQTYNASEEFTL